MTRQRQILLGVIALVVVFAAVLGFGFTGRKKPPPLANLPQIASNAATRDQDACASAATYARLKEVAFEEALKVRNSDPTNLDTLATHSVVRMENPVVKSRDAALNVTVCSGRFILELPPGAERAFGGQRRLTADIEYAAQAAADGSGLVYQINGAEPIIYRLATFDLQGQRYIPPQQSETQFADAAPALPPVSAPAPVFRQDIAAARADAVARSARLEAQARAAAAARAGQAANFDRAEQAERAERAQREARAERVRSAERRARAERSQRADAAPRGGARPSFSCRGARSRSERAVCSSGRLAARDRQMSSQFYSALAEADPRTRRRLRRTRDNFLAYRERCRSDACIAQAYEGRMREIDDIARSE